MKPNQVRTNVRSLLQFAGLALTAIILYGCYPQGAEFIDELDLVVTVRDDDTNYDDFVTYVLPDTIAYVSGDDEDELAPEVEARILAQIREELDAYGWVEEMDPEANSSDVAVLPTIIDNLNVTIVDNWWGYWGWWPGWGFYPPVPPGGWYPGYPGYCCYNQIYAWREGSLIIEMVDPNAGVDEGDSDADRIPLIWMGGLNGLLEGSASSIQARTTRGIDQIFEDSPYLNKN